MAWTRATGAIALAAGCLIAQAAVGLEDSGGRKGIAGPPGGPLKVIVSGYEFRTKQTQAMQDDDLENPGMLAIDRASAEWSKVDGAAGKSCASCHNDASKTMKGVGAETPKWSAKLNRPVTIEQQINICRKDHMKASEWKFPSGPLTDMTTYIRYQSRGMPVHPKIDGPAHAWWEKGKKIYYTRFGQLNLSCANCHEQYNGKFIRADFLSQGQTNDFPTYRLKSQGLVPLHQRFAGCIRDTRATPFKPQSDEMIALELYVAWRGMGLPIETPGVRN